MARLRFRDRFFTPPVARALTSPGGILLAGAGVSVAIVAGLPVVAAAAVGAVAWGARVGFAVPRTARKDRVDPFALADPWRSFVLEAQDASRRFDEAVEGATAGPLQERLKLIAERVDTGVGESWRIALAGQALTEARSRVDVADITRQLGALGGPPGTEIAPSSPRSQTLAALDSQLSSVKRLDEIIGETRDRLTLLDARLDEAVTRAIELSVRAKGSDELGGLDDDVDSLVGEMEALRAALDETDHPDQAELPTLPPAPDTA